MTTKLTETEAYAQGRNADADAIPTAETLTAVWELPVRDRTGKRVPFRDVVAGPDAAPRVLVIFIRHWFCPVSLHKWVGLRFIIELTMNNRLVKATFEG